MPDMPPREGESQASATEQLVGANARIAYLLTSCRGIIGEAQRGQNAVDAGQLNEARRSLKIIRQLASDGIGGLDV